MGVDLGGAQLPVPQEGTRWRHRCSKEALDYNKEEARLAPPVKRQGASQKRGPDLLQSIPFLLPHLRILRPLTLWCLFHSPAHPTGCFSMILSLSNIEFL